MSHHTNHWLARVDDWRRSGLSMAAWCRSNGVSYQTFLYWRKRLIGGRDEAAGFFLQLGSPAEPDPIALECNGVFVHVPPGFDHGMLREILAVLKGC